jgi:hypothetical protein
MKGKPGAVKTTRNDQEFFASLLQQRKDLSSSFCEQKEAKKLCHLGPVPRQVDAVIG